ncbi:MAG: polysaccharide lyase 6 family protein [Paludibacteraceae bacterium]|nr:polysaccharide lyase 6 family protein [Paludibacteraceae bacterium]
MRGCKAIGLWVLLAVSVLPLSAATQYCTQAKQVIQQLPAALPGDTFVLADGAYALSWLKLSCAGEEGHPIVLKAEHPLGARVTGTGCVTLNGASWMVFDGIDFDMSATSSIMKFQGAHHIRVTGCRFTMSMDKEGQTSKWILIGDIWENTTCNSGYNRFDHNIFENKQDGGPLFVIDGSHGGTPHISVHDTIDHNTFRNVGPRASNEKETIRIGVSDLTTQSAWTVVENNVFEDCDGDPEIVSVKSCDNVIRNNIFRRCLGTLCLRQGFRNTAENNSFYGEGKTAEYEDKTIGCGGIRVYGKDHIIRGNHMEGLTGDTWDAGLTITNGDATNSSTNYSAHFLPENVLITGNTLIDCASGMEVGFTNSGKYSKKPVNCVVSGNLFVRSPITFHTQMNDSQVRLENNTITDTDPDPQGIDQNPSPHKAEWVMKNGVRMLRMERGQTVMYVTLDGRIININNE